VLVPITNDLIRDFALVSAAIAIVQAAVDQRREQDKGTDEIDDLHEDLLCVFPELDDVAGFPECPVSDESLVRQKHPVPLALPYHSLDRIAQIARRVLAQLTGLVKIRPGDVDSLFVNF
jgi:hypothetical protein